MGIFNRILFNNYYYLCMSILVLLGNSFKFRRYTVGCYLIYLKIKMEEGSFILKGSNYVWLY